VCSRLSTWHMIAISQARLTITLTRCLRRSPNHTCMHGRTPYINPVQAGKNNYCCLDMHRGSQHLPYTRLHLRGSGRAVERRSLSSLHCHERKRRLRRPVVPLKYEPHVSDRSGRTEATLPNHGDVPFLIQHCRGLDLL